MAHSFRDMFIMFSIVSLFVFGTISFIATFQEENNANSSILENSLINSTFIDLGDGIISSQQAAVNESQVNFNEENPAPGFGSLIIFAIVGVTKTFTSLITTTYNTIIVLPITILGVPSQIANVIGSILMMSLIFMAWRVYRVGS